VPGELVIPTGHVYAGFRVSGVAVTDGRSNRDGGWVRSDAVRRYPCRGRPALASRARCPRHICPDGHTTSGPPSILRVPGFFHRHSRTGRVCPGIPADRKPSSKRERSLLRGAECRPETGMPGKFTALGLQPRRAAALRA
jgi:hypothetical protein